MPKGGGDTSDRQTKSNDSTPRSELQYFRRELTRLENEFDKDKSKTQKPQQKEYMPYIYNSLGPYTQLKSYRDELDKPVETERFHYVSRNTALRLCDPWVSYNMDNDFKRSPRRSETGTDSSRPSSCADSTRPSSNKGSARNNRAKSSSQRNEQQNTDNSKPTHLFPTVTAVPNEFTGKSLDYSHVPQLREELGKTYSANAQRKIDQQYELTKNEFYRRQLDRFTECHPQTQPAVRAAYFAYLQNNPGSSRAVHECVSETMKREKSGKDKEHSEAGSDRPASQKSSRKSSVASRAGTENSRPATADQQKKSG